MPAARGWRSCATGRCTGRKIDIAGDLGDRLAIANGLAEGDSVVLTPSARLSEGLRVEPRNAQ